MSSPTPISAPTKADPGDDTAKKYRYQYGYGVILWAAAYRGESDYSALWCEQHEDFLGQTNADVFDAFQIKTRRAENGPWEWNDDALAHSIERFVQLDQEFPAQIRHFYFVSNSECSDSQAKEKIHLAPLTVLGHLTSPVGPYLEFCEKALTALSKKTKTPRDALLSVLQRLRIVKGPAEDGFEAEIAHRHLPALKGCESLPPKKLTALLDAVIYRVWIASSKGSRDPSRHYAIINGNYGDDPQLLAKRIEVDSLKVVIEELDLPRFAYLTKFSTLRYEANRQDTKRLRQKLVGGGLGDYFDSMQRQTLSAERRLIELQNRDPEQAKQVSAQIESVVLSICEDAHLAAFNEKKSFGRPMLIRVKSDLKTVVEQRSDHVHREPLEMLVGMSGLLTEDCRVWWSKKFKLEGEP